MCGFACRFIVPAATVLMMGAVQPVWSATQLDPVPLDADDGARLGYAHVFTPDAPAEHANSGAEPIVFLPGFDLNLANLIEAASPVQPGSRARGSNILRDLVFTQSPNPASQHPQLFEHLIDEYGHTVVILEYADENAGVERNAAAVEALLTDPALPVMHGYQSTGTRSLLLGWSLGGLIGRYALTGMENDGIDHHVSLYISYDVPHRGARLPLSFEAFVALMRQVIVEQNDTPSLSTFELLLDSANNKFNSRSASELLKPHLGVASNVSVADSYRPATSRSTRIRTTRRRALSFMLSAISSRPWVTIPRTRGESQSVTATWRAIQLALPMPRDRNLLVRLTARVPITSRFKLRVMDIRLHDDTRDVARSNCSIRYFFETTRCPSFRTPDALQNLSVEVGSHTNVVSKLASVFENQQALIGEWLGQGYDVEFSSEVPAGEGLTTFVPMSSALDVASGSIDHASLGAEQTPFDAVYANATDNHAHNAVSPEVYGALLGEIEQQRRQRQVLSALPAIY